MWVDAYFNQTSMDDKPAYSWTVWTQQRGVGFIFHAPALSLEYVKMDPVGQHIAYRVLSPTVHTYRVFNIPHQQGISRGSCTCSQIEQSPFGIKWLQDVKQCGRTALQLFGPEYELGLFDGKDRTVIAPFESSRMSSHLLLSSLNANAVQRCKV